MSRLQDLGKFTGLATPDDGRFERTYGDESFRCSAISNVLIEFMQLFAEHDLLDSKYGLTPVTGSVVLSKSAAIDQLSKHASSLELSSIGTHQWVLDRKKLVEQFKHAFSTLDRVKWAIRNQKKFTELVTSMGKLNDGLKEITLTPKLQEMLDVTLMQNPKLSLQLLQIIERTPEFHTRYRITAGFRVDNILAQTQTPSAVQVSHLKVDQKCLSPTGPNGTAIYTIREFRTNPTADPINVLVEVKERSSRATNAQTQRIFQARIQSLASLLHKKPKPNGFRVLDLIGYVEETDPAEPAAKFIYQIPPDMVSTANDVSFFKLNTLFAEAGSRDMPPYFLGDRFRLARQLALAVHELHATNWLHRTLTSSHIVCLSPTKLPSIEFPYICGFSYARPDEPNELSETDTSQLANLYRHPHYQQPQPIKKYRRSYELYSLGVILLEIGLWHKISECHKTRHTPATFRDSLVKTQAPRLGHLMGKDYRDATVACLTGDFGVGDDEEHELSMAFEHKVIQRLYTLKA